MTATGAAKRCHPHFDDAVFRDCGFVGNVFNPLLVSVVRVVPGDQGDGVASLQAAAFIVKDAFNDVAVAK